MEARQLSKRFAELQSWKNVRQNSESPSKPPAPEPAPIHDPVDPLEMPPDQPPIGDPPRHAPPVKELQSDAAH